MPGRGALRGTPAASPITLTAQPRSLPRTAAALLWLTLLMRGQALVRGVQPAYQLLCLLWLQIAV